MEGKPGKAHVKRGPSKLHHYLRIATLFAEAGAVIDFVCSSSQLIARGIPE
jgi:hypothetical protein